MVETFRKTPMEEFKQLAKKMLVAVSTMNICHFIHIPANPLRTRAKTKHYTAGLLENKLTELGYLGYSETYKIFIHFMNHVLKVTIYVIPLIF